MKPFSWIYYIASLLFLPSCTPASEDNFLEGEITKAFKARDLSGLHGIVILHRGEVLAEKYFSGNDEKMGVPLIRVRPTADSLHDVRSVSKSITSLLYGIALSEGKVPALDDSLLAHFPEYDDLAADPLRRQILVRHALSMQMGLEWDESLPFTDPNNDEMAMNNAPDLYRYILDRPVVGKPGFDWTYNGGGTAIIARLIVKGTGKPLDAYAREKLFRPLGIVEFEWISGAHGIPLAESGLRLTLRDLAKIGTLVMNDGVWQGRQIVSAEWLNESFTPINVANETGRYGLSWYLSPLGEPPHWYAASGNGGQRLHIDKRNELVVAIFAGNYGLPDQWKLPVKIMNDFVLPAIQ